MIPIHKRRHTKNVCILSNVLNDFATARDYVLEVWSDAKLISVAQTETEAYDGTVVLRLSQKFCLWDVLVYISLGTKCEILDTYLITGEIPEIKL